MSQNNQNNSSMSSNTKYMIIAGVAILVVIALAIGVSSMKKEAPAPTTDTTAVDTSTATPTATDANDVGGETSWDAKLAEYSGRLIVFGADCSATPTDHVQAIGSTVLLANNSNVDHTISVGGASAVRVGARHYKTVKIATSNVQVVSCDANAKAATITVK
jgi:hypothetical protein